MKSREDQLEEKFILVPGFRSTGLELVLPGLVGHALLQHNGVGVHNSVGRKQRKRKKRKKQAQGWPPVSDLAPFC